MKEIPKKEEKMSKKKTPIKIWESWPMKINLILNFNVLHWEGDAIRGWKCMADKKAQGTLVRAIGSQSLNCTLEIKGNNSYKCKEKTFIKIHQNVKIWIN